MAADGDDGSMTESEEFFDKEAGGHDDPSAEKGNGGDGGGGASRVTAATTSAGVKQELLSPVKRLNEPEATPSRNAPPPIRFASLFMPSTAAAAGARGASLSSVSSRPGVSTAVKQEPRVAAVVRHSAPPSPVSHAYGSSSNPSVQCAVPASRPSPPAVQSSAMFTAMASSHASASSTEWPPPPPTTHMSSAASRGPQFNDYRAPVAFQASRFGEYAPSYGGSAPHMGAYNASYGGAAPFRPHAPTPGPSLAQPVYGCHLPPPVNYASPRMIQSQYQSLPVHEAAASSIRPSSNPTITSSTATPPPSSYSAPSLAGATVQFGGRAPSQCRHCFAKLNVPLLKIGRDCRCCGMIYPFSQFPMQNNQDKISNGAATRATLRARPRG